MQPCRMYIILVFWVGPVLLGAIASSVTSAMRYILPFSVFRAISPVTYAVLLSMRHNTGEILHEGVECAAETIERTPVLSVVFAGRL